MLLTRVVCRDGDVAEQTEAHGAIAERVMSGGTHGGERREGALVHRHVDGVEHAARARRRGVPRAFTHEGIRVELSAAGADEVVDARDVFPVVRQRDLVLGGVTPFDMR
jgi:hypothetical protein